MMYKIGITETSDNNIILTHGDNNQNAEVIDRNSVSQFTVKVKEPEQLREAADLISRILKEVITGLKIMK